MFHSPTQTIDLPTALAAAAGQSPRIAAARRRYAEAYARLEAAHLLVLPSIQAGASYNRHDGAIQEVAGRIIDPSRWAQNAGVGTGAVGAGSPAIPGIYTRFHVADAVFEPRIANRAAAARDAAADAVTNDLLLETALAYLDLLQAGQQQAITASTVGHAEELARLTSEFARVGQGLASDAERAEVERAFRVNEATRADEAARVASARLVELLSFDPMVRLVPGEPVAAPVDLMENCRLPPTELIAQGLENRPELAESRHLVGEAVHRYRREKFAPLLPSVLLGASYGGFGGGIGSATDNYRDRFDLDAAAWWEVRNFGFGERPARDAARAAYDQARFREIQWMDRVAREVVEAQAQVDSRGRLIAVAESAARAAENSFNRNFERIREGLGLPIEALQSLQALDAARREYLRSVIDYNAAQFRLQRALGWPLA
jgi:outer membrane protein TolC